MSLPNAITREDYYLNKIANPSDDHELPDAITRQQHYLKAIAENAGGGGGGEQPFIYSDTEREVGTWINGKKLYQKTLYIESLPNSTNVTYPHSIDNVDLIFVSNCFILAPDNSTTDVMLTNDNFNSMAQYWIDRTNIQIWAGIDRSSWSAYFTVQYTKTT